MKYQQHGGSAVHGASLPVWGEWIEMRLMVRTAAVLGVSLPVWGEWIEIDAEAGRLLKSMSLPVWGEWIEMAKRQALSMHPAGLSPCGESGLKLTWGHVITISVLVSPRVGRVD